MGRPIKKSFFGNLNPGGVGGEGISLVTLGTNPVSTQTVQVVFGAPNLSGGVQAAGLAVKTGNTVTSVTVTTTGSGYTSAPSVTFTGTNMSVVGSATATLTSVYQNSIAISAFVPGGSSAVSGDILKQESSRRYLVHTAQGTGQCRLVDTTPTEGQMTIAATDSLGSTYYVTKLTARRAILTTATNGGSGFEYTSGAVAGWTLGSATTGTVSVSNV
jgi:hypothetical protein